MNKILIIFLLTIVLNANSLDCNKFVGEYIGQESFIFIDGPMTGYSDTTESYFTIELKGADTLVFNSFGWLWGVTGFCKSYSIFIPVQRLGNPEDEATFSISGKGRLQNDTIIYEYYEGGTSIEGVYHCLGYGIKKMNTQSALQIETESLKCFPIPFKDYITIEYPTSEVAVLEILSAHGKLVFKKEINNSGSTKINLSSLPAGLYLVKLKTSSKTLTEKMLKN